MLTFKAVGAIALGLTLGAAKPDYTVVANASVKQMWCDSGAGTAFYVGHDTYLTVAHVTNLGGCRIDGSLVEVTHTDNASDFAVVHAPGEGKGLTISCEGFKRKQLYRATGYANALPMQRLLYERGTGVEMALRPGMDKMAIVVGPEFVPGMSGGPVQDDRGEVVGLVNAFLPNMGISFSQELRDSPVCKVAGSAWLQ